MIVNMKKVTMIVSRPYREDFLTLLRGLGVVHIKRLAQPSSGDLTLIEEEESLLQKSDVILTTISTAKGQMNAEHLNDQQILEKAKNIFAVKQQCDELERKIQQAEDGMAWYRPWGKFSPPEVASLGEKDICIRLYRLNGREYKKISSRGNVHLISRTGGYFYVAAAYYQQEEHLPFEEIRLPVQGYDELQAQTENYKKELDELEDYLREQVAYKQEIDALIIRLQHRHRFLEVLHGMRSEEDLSLLQGFCPVNEISRLTEQAKKNGAGYLIEDPDNPEETPTLIRNPRWVSIINPVFRFMNTIPGYNEFDISLVFLIFFSLFFAMLIGDAGYGFIFLTVTWLIKRKAKNVPPQPFYLMYVMSIATIIWGAMTGTWFGIEQVTHLPVFRTLIISKINSFVANQNLMIFICFIIGVVQLTIAHLMKCIREINSIKALADLGWIGILWGLFFVAGTLVIYRPFPPAAGYLLGSGIILVLLFSNPQKNILKGVGISLANIPLKVINSFSDIVSYIRLFAVGYASVIMASSFNGIALNIGFGSVVSGFIAALILFMGHSLNIALGMMAVIVHGIRLNMLEFSGHLDMQWCGKKYMPFSEKTN